MEAALGRQEERPPASSSNLPVEVKRMAQAIIATDYHTLAQRHHPDRGGRHEEMTRLNQARDWLKEQAA